MEKLKPCPFSGMDAGTERITDYTNGELPRYIKLDDAIATLHKYYPLSFDRQDAEDDLKSIPPADVEEVRHGEWIDTHHGGIHGDTIYRCSVCGNEREAYLDEENYCPNCGAKMDGKESGDESCS